MQFRSYLCALITYSGLTLSMPIKSGKGPESSNDMPPLLLVSFDGFRADYLKKYPLPNLEKFFSDGVLVRELTNVFTTKTFPNHYSLVTGLYAESHGILASMMYDPVVKKHFSLQNGSDPFWWDEATPIWVSVEESGYKAASAMWPGTNVDIQNHTLKYKFEYDSRVTFQERLGNLTKWMTEDKSVKFASLYWEEPDRSGHHYGPDNATEMARVLTDVDNLVGVLMEQLNKTGLWGKINIIITSDHGMTQCSQERLIKLDNCISPSSYTIVDLTPVGAIIPLADNSTVYKKLSSCHNHMKVYLKDAVPDRLHYKNNERIQPIILVADEGWTIVKNGGLPRLGDHGYDNTLPSMHPFLAAHGPAFRKGYKMSSFNSVDLYPLMCHLIGIPPMPNNGSFAHVRCALVNEQCGELALAVGIVLGVLIILTTFTCLFKLMKKRSNSSTRPFARLELEDDEDDEPLLE
ncbi:bis(5'-adenosyl)-triphosphatase enpp4-like [Myxocyprinus asiaticus]|uniref:bis(5'-adenosyl)-triphosphatase enpp4-like n=1 Tax=Myxocyprinus asiaticus TaxID=70543 RepID=UPI002221657B|nr:bis(5'-adenosyl)-triphosphatase enpp4-like [Myxocyprinus asiaticus]